MIYSHVCPHCERVTVTSKKFFACVCVNPAGQRRTSTVWDVMHRYAIDRWMDWSAADAAGFYARWLPTIPSFGCECQSNWAAYTADHPPDFSSARAFFAWSIAAHNHVSAEHAVPRKRFMPLMEAEGLYRAPWVVRRPRGMITRPPDETQSQHGPPLADFAQNIDSGLILLGDDIDDRSVRRCYAWHFNRLLWVRSDVLIPLDTPDVFRLSPVADDFASNHHQTFLDLWFTYCFVQEEVRG